MAEQVLRRKACSDLEDGIEEPSLSAGAADRCGLEQPGALERFDRRVAGQGRIGTGQCRVPVAEIAAESNARG